MKRQALLTGIAVLLCAADGRAAAAEPGAPVPAAPTPLPVLQSEYLYPLADTNGPLPSSWAAVAYEPVARETFVVNSTEGTVRIFNAQGMETFVFGDDGELGNVRAVAPFEDGELVVLTSVGRDSELLRCDFRGRARRRLQPRGFPPELAAHRPDGIAVSGGKLYSLDSAAMRVVVTDPDYGFLSVFDLGARMDAALAAAAGARSAGPRTDRPAADPQARRADNPIGQFSVSPHGHLLFTFPTLFTAVVVTPAGELREFGVRGSAPGKFNVVSGIAMDEAGVVYVTDLLRAAVMVFDPDLRFVGEFGHRGPGPDNLVAPQTVVAGHGRVFVTQSAERGVSVFRVALATADGRTLVGALHR